jgi:hypothetical protein
MVNRNRWTRHGMSKDSLRHHSAPTERARARVAAAPFGPVVPRQQLRLPHEGDGSQVRSRALRHVCLPKALNDYEAVQSLLFLHESAATRRVYRKETERLVLWEIVDRSCILLSLTTDDAIAYRAFLRRPAKWDRWIGPSRSRQSVECRPFSGPLSTRSVTYALTVLASLYRWKEEPRYVLANRFTGVKVRGSAKTSIDVTRSCNDPVKTCSRHNGRKDDEHEDG